jgi:outer membrane immunogenic protein
MWGIPGPNTLYPGFDRPDYVYYRTDDETDIFSWYNYRFRDFSAPQTTLGSSTALSGIGSNSQSGFIGGGQIGYNYQWGSSVVVGIEADMQGSGIRGISRHIGVGMHTDGATDATDPVFVSNLRCSGSDCSSIGGAPLAASNGSINRFVSRDTSATGIASIYSGVDWLGTLRGRLGYLFTPTMLFYATGGLTYGGVYANVRNYAEASSVEDAGYSGVLVAGSGVTKSSVSVPGISQTFVGGGSKSQTLVGWNGGGGLEWLFMPNWSLKAEAIYWNMGNMNVPTYAAATSGNYGSAMTYGATRVNYQGVIARAGVNYHFNWFAPAPVAAKY